MTLIDQATTTSLSVSGPLFQLIQYVANGGFSIPLSTSTSSSVGDPIELSIGFGSGDTGSIPGTISLNGVLENTSFTGFGFVTSDFTVPILAPLSQSTLVVPATVTNGGFDAGGYTNTIAIVTVNFAGIETLYLTSDTSGYESIDEATFVSTTGSDQITIPTPPGIPEPGTYSLFLAGSIVLLWLGAFRRQAIIQLSY